MITIINFSQRVSGINDALCDLLRLGFIERDVEVHYRKVRDMTLGICSNCRACMKSPGNELGKCHLHDDMQGLIETMLNSSCIIVSAPINCYDLPSPMRVMLERMSVFCYWPDDHYNPQVRKMSRTIQGELITTSALPGIMVPLVTRARKTFRLFAKPLNITGIHYHHIGFKGRKSDMVFTEKNRALVRNIINRLAPLHTRSAI